MPINVPGLPPTRCNILIVGESGVGKSSIVNLIVGKPVALTDPGARLCTLQPQCYNVDIGPLTPLQLALYDTPGLPSSFDRMKGLNMLFRIYSLISQLESSPGGISLLVYCMKAGMISVTAQQTYHLFVEVFCGKVPVVIVFTHCEAYNRMEDWWEKNEKYIMNYGLHSIGHACITATPGYKGLFLDKYEQSRETIWKRLLDGLASRKDDNKRVALHVPKWLAARRTDRNSSELRKKLIKRCGYSREDAEIIARRIDESRRLPPTTTDEYKVSTVRASLSMDTTGSTYYSFADPHSDDEETENESGQIHGTAPSDQE